MAKLISYIFFLQVMFVKLRVIFEMPLDFFQVKLIQIFCLYFYKNPHS